MQPQAHSINPAMLFESHTNLQIKQYQLIPYNVRLKTPWETASSTLYFRQGLLVKLIINESLFAIGECAPMEEIGTESLAQAQDFLHKQLPFFINKSININLLSDMDLFPACRFAIETALLSLIAQQEKKEIVHLLNRINNGNNEQKTKSIKVNSMLGPLNKEILSTTKKQEKLGFSCFKIKLGLKTLKEEIQALELLFKKTSPSTLFKLDANKSWTLDETGSILNFLKPYEQRIDCLEEPLKDYDYDIYQKLQNSTPVNIALDESFLSEGLNLSKHTTNIFENYPVKQLILKPMALGGILKTLELVKQAQQYKIKTTITSSIETAYGLWPIVHLCATVNNKQFHGLATASWLEDTLIEPPEINHGIITL
ncbi:MAG: o-succinylbenzoate synthase [Gammaproteobacteria bacterium]|nr:o-succinylbenzoate synthase [Gammaproteobacteria bacterium]